MAGTVPVSSKEINTMITINEIPSIEVAEAMDDIMFRVQNAQNFLFIQRHLDFREEAYNAMQHAADLKLISLAKDANMVEDNVPESMVCGVSTRIYNMVHDFLQKHERTSKSLLWWKAA
jgi:hypothetical protein